MRDCERIGAFLLLASLSFSCSALSTRKPAAQGGPGTPAAVQKPQNPWAVVQSPSSGKRGPIGFYSAGCLDGGIALPINGKGFQVMRLSRHRYYGAPELINYITHFTNETVKHHVGVLLIGDMSQARGGPMQSSHASHQIGLDADIWYMIDPDAQYRPLTAEEREDLSAISLVDIDKGEIIPDLWRPEYAEMLKLAAEQPEVDRIFVNAAIKKHLCETTDPHHRAWLHKLRPWFGHADHFHVRLQCPAGDPYCRHQAPVPPGDGCDASLAWWFTPEARAKDKAAVEGLNEMEGPAKLPKLPDLCSEVLQSGSSSPLLR